jgi:hypothetical protein
MLKTALWFFLAGVVLAITLEILWRMVGYSPTGYAVERVARVLWPSSVFKMALDGKKDSGFQVAAVYALSFVANGVLYGLLGLLIGLVKNLRKS